MAVNFILLNSFYSCNFHHCFGSQARQQMIERTNKWLKMTKGWEKYFPGEKVGNTVLSSSL